MSSGESLADHNGRMARMAEVLIEHGIDASYVNADSATLSGEFGIQRLEAQLRVRINKGDFDYIKYGKEREGSSNADN